MRLCLERCLFRPCRVAGGRYGVLLDEVGFTPQFTNQLVEKYIQPLAAALYTDFLDGHKLDNHRCFTVEYETGEGKDLDLAAHFDNAEVTLNVSLGDDFDGGDLEMFGWHAYGQQRRPPLRVTHVKGQVNPMTQARTHAHAHAHAPAASRGSPARPYSTVPMFSRLRLGAGRTCRPYFILGVRCIALPPSCVASAVT